MKKSFAAMALLAVSGLAFAAWAQAPSTPLATLDIKINGIEDGKPIPQKFAYCAPDAGTHTKNGGNVSPSISWAGAPIATKSYALIVVDRDVPATFDDANRPDKKIAADFPRQDFYHWVLVDIPPASVGIPEAKDSSAITPGGKTPGKTEYGINGQNDYAAKASMGKGGGYDGPCPPWNDERLHHYHFIVYALDVGTLGLSGNFTGKQAEDAMKGHVLAQGEVVGTYTQNVGLFGAAQ